MTYVAIFLLIVLAFVGGIVAAKYLGKYLFGDVKK